ncbi:MAG: T9SS type A sorting domain-containing protein [Saprospiraceae bacterium]
MKPATTYFICFFFLFRASTYSQPDPIKIQFVEAQPLWEHIIWDTSYYDVGIQPDINKYTVVNPFKCYRFNNDLVLEHLCINYNAELYGYILEKLDIQSGVTKWQNYSTYYNNGFQDFYKDVYLRADGNLEMTGIKRFGPYLNPSLAYWNSGGGKSNFVRKIFDFQSGDLIRTIIGHDSIRDIVPPYLNFFPLKIDSSYLLLDQIGVETKGGLVFGYNFYKLNDQQDIIDTLSQTSILYQTSDTLHIGAFNQPPLIQKLDDTTLVALFFQDKIQIEKLKAQLVWISIKNLKNIRVFRRINIEEFIPGGESTFTTFMFEVTNNKIYISQPYYNQDIQSKTAYLLCLDHEGNIVHDIPNSTETGNIYNFLRIIYTSDDYDYFMGSPSRTGRYGFDILKLNHNSDSFQYISSLTSAVADEVFTRQIEVKKLYDDGFFIIGAYTKKLGPVQNSAVKYYCFKGSDLGMQAFTTSLNPTVKGEFKAYPNPTDGIVNFDLGTNFTGRIQIYDLMGMQIGAYQVIDSGTFKVDLRNLPNGMYYAAIQNQKTNTQVILKIVLSSAIN